MQCILRSTHKRFGGLLLSALMLHLPLLAADRDTRAAPVDNLAQLEKVPENSRKTVEAAVAYFKEVFEAIKKQQQSDKESGNVNLEDKLKVSIQKLENAIVKASKVPQLYYYIGIAYQLAEKFSRAKVRLERCLKMKPDFYEAIVEYGDVYVWLKEFKKAIKEYDKALKINPSYGLAMERKAQALIKLGKFEDAKTQLLAAQKVRKSKGRTALLGRLEVEIKGPRWQNTYTATTKNFIIKTSVSQEFADDVAEAAERIHKAYAKVFPKTKRTDRKYPIYLHKDRNEYIANGGPTMAGGHYDPYFRVLVLFKYAKFKQTIAVLNHEAFHQFIDDYMDSPPQWFNEGVAEYFGAFEYIPEKKLLVPRPNRNRLGYVKAAIAARKCPPAEDLMLMSRAEMYSGYVGVHYAQAWGMIYFMIHGGKSAYKKLLVNYFKSLQKGKDIDEAYKATFARMNQERFEREWKSFINRTN